MTKLPDSLFNLTELTHLYIQASSLEIIPDKIIQLKKLEEINISENPIEILSENIFALPNLKYINILMINLRYLPVDSIKNAMQKGKIIKVEPEKLLSWVTVENSFILESEYLVIKEIEKNLGNSLKLYSSVFNSESSYQVKEDHVISLTLCDGNAKIPEEILELKYIQNLAFINYKLNEFPVAILKLLNLKKLILINTGITSIPNDIIKLEKLEYINLDSNRFIDFPQVLLKHPNINIVYLNDNQIMQMKMDKTILYPPKRFILYIHQNPISPESLMKISSLFKKRGYSLIYESNKNTLSLNGAKKAKDSKNQTEDQTLTKNPKKFKQRTIKRFLTIPANIPESEISEGYCIRCGNLIDYNKKKPYCLGCYLKWNERNRDKFRCWKEEHYCHLCGIEKEYVSYNNPICDDCMIVRIDNLDPL